MDEHLLIQKYFSNIGSAFLAEHNVEVSVGDDASVIAATNNTHQINSIDTSIEGVHFIKDMSPSDIAYRSCVVALSDLAACGARPQWYSIALTIPELKESWVKEYSEGLIEFSEEYKIPLVGGDTTKGTLSITVQVMGEVDSGKAILRSSAKEDQLIFVSGTIGDAYLGLRECNGTSGENKNRSSYLRPKAKIDLGLELDSLICEDFEKHSKSKNLLFAKGIDFIYEVFNLENRINNNIVSKSAKLLGKNKIANSFFTKFADNGLQF